MKQLKQFGHVVRIGDDRKPRQIMETWLQGKEAEKYQEKHVDGIDERARKNGTGVIELRKIIGNKRDWRKWIEAVPTLWGIRDGERRETGNLENYIITKHLF